MSTTAINGVSSSTGTNYNAITSAMSKQTLNQDDFLKLLVTQLSAQDPMNPMKDTEFVSQMAQFSALEQTRSMQTDISGLRSDQQLLQANSMIGRTVAIQSGSSSVTGVVSGVSLVSGTPQIIVNGTPYAMGSIVGVTTPTTTNNQTNN